MPMSLGGLPLVTGTVDPGTGTLHTSAPLGEYLLAPVRFTRVGFAGPFVAGPSSIFGPMALVLQRLGPSPRLAFVVQGTDDSGWITPPQAGATIALVPAPGNICWQTTLLAPPIAPTPITYSVGGPGLHLAGSLVASEGAVLRLPKPVGTIATVRITVHGRGQRRDGSPAVALINVLQPVGCG
jgi:hypothetical protein